MFTNMQVNVIFLITFSHFPLNVISSLLARLADSVFPMPGESLAIVLVHDGSRAVVDWQHYSIPCASCTDPDRAHSLLRCSYHACHHARREEKEGKAGGVLSARRGYFLYTLLLDKKPISNLSRWLKKLRISFSMCIICGEGGSLIITFNMILFLPVWARRDARWLLLIR